MAGSCMQSGHGAPGSAEQLRAVVWELLRAREYGRATTLLEAIFKITGKVFVKITVDGLKRWQTCRDEAKEEIRTLWYEVQYVKLMEQLGSNKLTAVQRFRCRKRNPLPHSLRLEGQRTRSLPPEARQRLMVWARGNTASPTGEQREELMKETGLKKQQIYDWFANYRRKLRKANRQLKGVGEMNLSQRSPTASTLPWTTVIGSTQPDSGELGDVILTAVDLLVNPVVCQLQCGRKRGRQRGGNKAVEFEWTKCEQISVKQPGVTDNIVVSRPGLSNPQCCQGCPSHCLLFGQTDPTTSLAAAPGRWCWTGTASAHVTLCPCLPLAVSLAPAPEVPPTPQPNGPLRSGGESGSAAALWHPCPGEGSLHRGEQSLQSSDQMSRRPPHPFGDRHQAGTGTCWGADGAIDAHQHLTWADVGEVNPALAEGSFQTDLSWQISLSNASHHRANRSRRRPFGPSSLLCHSTRACSLERRRWRGLNWSSEWTIGMHSAEKPQNTVEGVKPVCRRLACMKLEEAWCDPALSQLQRDLDLAAQALIQLSQPAPGRPAGGHRSAAAACHEAQKL